MPIYTPRGLKIRLDPVYAFGIMSRLEPDVRPFEILSTTEAVEEIPASATFLCAVILAVTQQSPSVVFGWCAGVRIVATSLTRFGMFVIPGMVALGRIYSQVAVFGLSFAIAIGLLWWRTGWRGAAAYVGALLVGGVLTKVLDIQRVRYYMRRVGHPLTAAEINFFSAYRLHAAALGKSTDLATEDERGERARGAESLARFADEWPSVAGRFSTP